MSYDDVKLWCNNNDDIIMLCRTTQLDAIPVAAIVSN